MVGTAADPVAPNARERLLRAAAELLAAHGRDALSTRAVSAAAGMQQPALYRLFGDKDGLLDALAAYAFEEYLRDKHAVGTTDDPVDDLRRGWDVHVEFGLTHPALYALMYGEARFRASSPAGQEAADLLRGLISRVARTGRLRMSVERAARLVGATGVGLVLTLIAMPPAERDLEIVTIARESTLRAILTDAPAPASGDDSLTSRAVALRETLGDSVPALSAAERALLTEWLDRIAATQRGRVTPAPRSGP